MGREGSCLGGEADLTGTFDRITARLTFEIVVHTEHGDAITRGSRHRYCPQSVARHRRADPSIGSARERRCWASGVTGDHRRHRSPFDRVQVAFDVVRAKCDELVDEVEASAP